MTSPADKLVADYLKRLNAELRGLPRARRKEIVAEISEHIAEARALHPAETEAEIRTVLDRLGDPAEIAAAARPRAVARTRWQEPAAIVLLLLGGFVFLVGWVVGLILLWSSDRWTTRDRLIGTLIVPFGLVLPVSLFVFAGTGAASSGSSTCNGLNELNNRSTFCITAGSGGGGATRVLWLILGVAVLVAPLATAAYLSLRLRRPARGGFIGRSELA